MAKEIGTAKIIQEVSTGRTASQIKKKMWKSLAEQSNKYTPEEALILYGDGHFTKHTYILI